MDTAREVETKLSVPGGFLSPSLVEVRGVDRVAVSTLRLRATYWDSDDARLARGGVTLRHRTGEGRPRWTLKTASAGPVLDREELSVPGAGTRVPAALEALLTARLRGAALLPLAQVRTVRTTTLLFDAHGEELVEVVDDSVTVLRDGAVVDGWRELEVEQRPGAGKVADRVVAVLTAAGAGATDQVPKGVRAVGGAVEPDLPEPPRVRRAGDLVRAALAQGLRTVVDEDLAVRRGLPDSVHQLRVACRRLRSDLRTFADLVDDDRTDLLRAELSWLAGSLGAARDLEVLRDRLRARALDGDPLDVSAVDVLLLIDQRRAEAAVLEALRSPRYLVLLQLLHDLAGGVVVTELGDRPAHKVLPGLVRRTEHRLDRAVRALTVDAEDTAWHRARIAAKRARYAAEAVLPGVPKRAKRLQTLLGEHQDAVVAAERLQALAVDHPELGVLLGRLVERERRTADAVRRSVL